MSRTRIVIDQRRHLDYDLLLTAVVRDLAVVTEGRVDVEVRSLWPEVWANNPHVTKIYEGIDGQPVQYLPIQLGTWKERASAGQFSSHALLACYEEVRSKIQVGRSIPCLLPKPDIHLADTERRPRRVPGPYWVFVTDPGVAAQAWPASYWAELSAYFYKANVKTVQVTLSASVEGLSLPSSLDLSQKLNLREVMAVLSAADGIIGYPGPAMHLAAAFDRPCIVLAGGREPVSWHHYRNDGMAFGEEAAALAAPHTYLHQIGRLPCCVAGPCGKKTLPAEDQAVETFDCLSVTSLPLAEGTERVAQCQATLAPSEVIRSIEMIRQPTKPRRGVSVPVTYRGGPPAVTDAPPAGALPGVSAIDHPTVGSKVTIFVLLYGPYTDLAKRCIRSIIDTVPAHQRDLRVGANIVSPETKDFLRDVSQEITHVYYQEDPAQAVKYPFMRRLFRDSVHPIATNYTLWFDDDSYCYHHQWLEYLARAIVAYHDQGYRLYGVRLRHSVKAPVSLKPTRMWPGRPLHQRSVQRPSPNEWFQSATWWKNQPYRNEVELPSPNGAYTYFAAGGWWAIHTPLITQADIPDTRLWHNGGDITIGEQVNQAGYRCFDINGGNGLVRVSDSPRRGSQSPFPWDKRAMAAYNEQGVQR